MKKYFSLLLILIILLSISCEKNKGTFYIKLNESVFWRINPDATFDLKVNKITIHNCMPSIDCTPLIYEKAYVKKNADTAIILYTLYDERKISIKLAKDSSSLIITAQISGKDTAPAYFSPIAFGNVSGADRFFKQGIGFAGPSGVFQIPLPLKRVDKNGIFEDVWSYDSYITFGLFAPDNSSFAMGTYDNQNFMQRTIIYNRQHRFGLVDRWLDDNKVYIDAGFSTEKIPLINKIIKLPDIHILPGKQPFNTMQQLAKNIAKHNHVKLNQKAAYHWCSWYEHTSNFNETILNEFLEKIKTVKPNPDIQTIQIDDGYSFHGDWLISNDNFPSGMEANIKKIISAGYRAGIWIAPFMVSENSEIFKKHPDWLLRDLDGNHKVEGEFRGMKTYVIDTSNPEAFEYLRSIFKGMKKMGIEYFKTDFMDWGLRNSMHWKRHTSGKTSTQYFTDVVKMIREEIGPESFWLGCISPFAPMIGYADGMRVANDLPESWNEFSQPNMAQETMADQYFNNIFWQNDPDVLYLDGFKTGYTPDEKQSIIYWIGLLGGIINTSDRFHQVSKHYMELWQFIKPSEKTQNADFPFWDKPGKLRVITKRLNSDSWALLVFNQNPTNQSDTLKMNGLINQNNIFVFNWKPRKSIPLGEMSRLELNLKPHQSALFYLNLKNEMPALELNINGLLIDEKK